MQGKSGEALRIAGEVPDRLNGKKGLYLGKIHIIMEKTKEYRAGRGERYRGGMQHGAGYRYGRTETSDKKCHGY